VLTEKSIMPATPVQLHQLWTIEVVAADGAEISLAGQTSDVVEKQSDGNWLFVIDNPFGGEGI
jgi:ketosteroid isomerase-like protein